MGCFSMMKTAILVLEFIKIVKIRHFLQKNRKSPNKP